jgi:hypothetical protein
MPTISWTVERLGYAEDYTQRLDAVIETKLNGALNAIKDDIAVGAPHRTGELANSFYVIPATGGNLAWEGYIASTKAAQARAHNYGSGVHGPSRSTYPIEPKTSKFLRFEKEGEIKYRRLVMHPGVYALHYIERALRKWTPILLRELGEGIQLAAVHHWGTY